MHIQGIESLGIGESLRLFFEEFFTETDRKLAQFKTSLHTINFLPVEEKLSKQGILFVNNANVRIPTPTYFKGGEGEMVYYVDNIITAIIVVEGFKTEVQRFYDWMKQVVKMGRVAKTYNWTVTKYETQVAEATKFIKELEEGKTSYPLKQVYVNFPEAFGMMLRYNKAAASIKARDAEVMARDLKNVYDLGNLLVSKIQSNDIVVDPAILKDVQDKINLFNSLTSVVGGCLGLINEMSAVFNSQLDEFKKFK